MVKIKNRKHFDTAEEIVTEFLDKIQKIAAESEQIFHSEMHPQDKARALNYRETQVATLANFLRNDLGYDIRLEDGADFSSRCFNRIFYFRQMAEIEADKAQEAGV